MRQLIEFCRSYYSTLYHKNQQILTIFSNHFIQMNLNLHKRRSSYCGIGADISAVIPFACAHTFGFRAHFAASAAKPQTVCWFNRLEPAQTASYILQNWHRHFRRYSVCLPTLSAFRRRRNRKRRCRLRSVARTTKGSGICPLPFVVRATGLEPAHLAIQDPKSCASANFAMPAYYAGLAKFLRTCPRIVWAWRNFFAHAHFLISK